MKTPNLLEILAIDSRLHHVQLIPKSDDPIDFFEFYDEILQLAKGYGLAKYQKGAHRGINLEQARQENRDPFKDNHCIKYAVKFSNRVAAHTFMLRLNEDLSARYRAALPTEPVGFLKYKPIERIS